MNETRVTVDQLLADGKIDQAEAYMEQRRELFVAHGYLIRKLNQAYFAFYGGYQTASPGEGGSDPIGPAVAAIKHRAPRFTTGSPPCAASSPAINCWRR